MIELNRESAVKILEVCKMIYGESSYNNCLPFIKILKDKKFNNSKKTGHYINGKICLYINNIKTIDVLIQTIIHEYTHYLLNPKEYIEIEENLKKQGLSSEEIYEKHPHEIICNKAEQDLDKIKTSLIKLNETN